MLPPHYTHLPYQTIDSTNTQAKRLIQDTPNLSPTIITATSQTSGRGRYDRTWESPQGNSYTSLILPKETPLETLPQLSFVTAIGVRDTILELAGDKPLHCRYKWPNDVLINDKKVAGILLEATNYHIIIGIGINLIAHPPQTNYPATNLAESGISNITTDDILPIFIHHFDQHYRQWLTEGFAPIRTKWLAHGTKEGALIKVQLADKQISAMFAGLNGQGELLLRGTDDNQTITRIAAGDIFE